MSVKLTGQDVCCSQKKVSAVNAKHKPLTQLAMSTVLSTGCLTNFLPFTMACDQMAVTLDKHMALRTEVAVLTKRHLQYHKVPDITMYDHTTHLCC